MSMGWIDELKWDDQGLIPAIAQDYESGRVLMMAWMNRESLELTQQEQRAVYWSRSRQSLWRKGESSGNVQKVHDIFLDCDSDVLLLKVEQLGEIACHTGRESCFYRNLKQSAWQVVDDVKKSPEEMYGSSTDSTK